MTSSIAAEGPGSSGHSVLEHARAPRSRGARLRVADALQGLKASQIEEWFGFWLSRRQRHFLQDVLDCGTAVLGGHVVSCNDCEWSHTQYNACGHRFCPTCAAREARKWVLKRRDDVLPVPYYHVVFTIPSELSELALSNPEVVCKIALSSAGAALMAAMSKGEGGCPGVMTVLHTWSQELMHHVHVHCLVAGGVLSKDESRWVSLGTDALPPTALVEDYRRRFLQDLSKAHAERPLYFSGRFERLSDAGLFASFVEELETSTSWGVWVKEPPGSVEELLTYLVRGPISDDRIVRVDGGRVTISCRARGDAHGTREVTMNVLEFARRLVTHVLPKRLVRIRYYGFWASAVRTKKLARIRELLGVECEDAGGAVSSTAEEASPEEEDILVCPRCGSRDLEHVERISLRLTPASYRCSGPRRAQVNTS